MAKVKLFFKKVGLWFKNHAPTKRRLIQIYTALLFNANIKGLFGEGQNIIYRGGTKNLCAPGLNCYSCPGAVASCPLGALQNALAESDNRAPYYIIGILGLLGLLFARTICGFFCPVGLGQELLYKVKTPKLKKSRFTRILSYFKYVLLVVFVIAIPLIYSTVPGFCKYICPAGTSAAALQLANSNNSDLYMMLGFLFSWKFLLLIAFIVLSVFIYRFFCRFICPLGAIYGFFNKIALLGVKLDKKKCVDCGLCVQTCQMDIKTVGDHECINCGACIPVCPTQAISWKGSKIFVHGSEIPPATEEQVKPVTAITEKGITVTANAGEATMPTAVESQPPVEKEINEQVNVVEKKFKKRAFWLQFAAWAVALAVLVGALVYYNFLAKSTVATTFGVGDKCPDFTLERVYDSAGAYGENGEKIEKFSSLESKGTVVVLNYWYTTCGPCVAELPAFNRVKEEFGDQIIMVAIHENGEGRPSDAAIQLFIDNPNNDKESWTDYSIIFALDTPDSYTILGGKTTYPMTVIIDAEGTITHVQQGSFSEDALREQIQNALNK